MQPLLSILIPSTHDRLVMTALLVDKLMQQIESCGERNNVRIHTDIDNRETIIGAKRNRMVEGCNGKYVCHFDSDDEPADNYIKEITGALYQNPDVVGFRGHQTTNGKDRVDFKISKDLPYTTAFINGKPEYWRYNNHLSPVRREIALQIKFPDISFGEDYDYATRLKNSGLIKTEVFIDDFLYHYKFLSNKI